MKHEAHTPSETGKTDRAGGVEKLKEGPSRCIEEVHTEREVKLA